MDEQIKVVLNTAQAAQYLGCSVECLREAARRKEVPHYKIGRQYMFRPETLEKWIANQEETVSCDEATDDSFEMLLHRGNRACRRR